MTTAESGRMIGASAEADVFGNSDLARLIVGDTVSTIVGAYGTSVRKTSLTLLSQLSIIKIIKALSLPQ